MSIKTKAPDLGILESRAALGVQDIFGRNPDVGNLRGGKTARDIEARRSSSEFHPWNRDGAVVAEEDIPGEPRRSGKDRGGHLRQQPGDLGGQIETKPAAGALAIEGGVARRPDALAGVKGDLGVEGVERAAANDAELHGRAARNIGEMRENSARRLVEVDAEVEALAIGHEIEPDIERRRTVEPLHIEKEPKPLRGRP